MAQEIRPFTVEDIDGLLAVEAAVWNTARLNPMQAVTLATHPSHGVWVADVDGVIAGFAWCFLTHTYARGASWELDVLAVHPDYRHRGLGTALAGAAFAGGQQRGARQARAIVATTNYASYRAFISAGYHAHAAERDLAVRPVRGLVRPERVPPADPLHELYDSYLLTLNALPTRLTAEQLNRLADNNARELPLVRIEALPVYTLLYSGLWIESFVYEDENSLIDLLDVVEQMALTRAVPDVTTLLWPQLTDMRATLLAEGFEIENTYYVMTKAYLD